MIGELYVLQLLGRHSPDPWIRAEAGERPESFTVERNLVAVPDLRRDADAGAVMPARCVRFTIPAGRGRRHPRVGFVLVMFLGDDFSVRPAQLVSAAAPVPPPAPPQPPR